MKLPDGVKIGHAHDETGLTGCTVVLFDAGVPAVAEIRGSAAATSSFSLLDPVYSSSRTDAIFLTGGSSFGLSAVVGVQRFLEDRGQGFDVGVTNIPRVPAAAIYDLGVGDYTSRPNHHLAMDACLAAGADLPAEGSVGVGMGATVGKFLGIDQAMRGGFGAAYRTSPYGAQVCVFVVVNAFGDVWLPFRKGILAGARKSAESHEFADTEMLYRQGWRREGYGLARKITAPPTRTQSRKKGSAPSRRAAPHEAAAGDEINPIGGSVDSRDAGPENTTLVVALTTARLDAFALAKLSGACHQGMSEVIRPAHTIYDGDLAIAASVGSADEDLTTLCVITQDLVTEAIASGVKAARKACDIPSSSDLT
jgi:L-aminopeptidase/D-esterase-like protein